MHNFTRITLAVPALLTGLLIAAPASAASLPTTTLVEDGFETATGFPSTAPPLGTYKLWSGPSWGEYGMPSLDQNTGANASDQSIAIEDRSGINDKSPSFSVNWADWWSEHAPTTGSLRIAFSHLVPEHDTYDLATSFKAPLHIGSGGWSAPVTLRYSNGRIFAQYAGGENLLGNYSVGAWDRIELDFSLADGTVDIRLNGELVLQNVQMKATASSLREISFWGDRTERDTETYQSYVTNHIDDISVQYVSDPVPEPATLGLLGLGALLLARRH